MRGKQAKRAKGKGKKILAAALAALALWAVFLRKPQEEALPEEPEGDGRIALPGSYSLAGVEIAALPALGEGVVVYPDGAAKPADPDKEGAEAAQPAAAAGDSGKDSETGPLIYRYQGLSAPGALAAAYAALLSTPDAGFYLADEGLSPIQAPEGAAAAAGSVILARTLPELPETPQTAEAAAGGLSGISAEAALKTAEEAARRAAATREKQRLTVELSWEEDRCSVTVAIRQVRASGKSGGAVKLSVPSAGEYISTLSPSVLGLEGESMSQYRVYVADGSVIVNGLPCIRVNVCQEESGDLAGNYLLSADHHAIYQLNADSGTVTLLTGSE